MARGMLQSTGQSNLADSLGEFHTETGRSLLDLVVSPVLLIFLRHFACAFCAQAIAAAPTISLQIHSQLTKRHPGLGMCGILIAL
jgi:hypothetical protein